MNQPSSSQRSSQRSKRRKPAGKKRKGSSEGQRASSHSQVSRSRSADSKGHKHAKSSTKKKKGQKPGRGGRGLGRAGQSKTASHEILAPAPPLLPLTQNNKATPVGKKANLLALKSRQPAKLHPRPEKKRHAVAFFASFAEARGQKEALASQAQSCDQLNLVIAEEGDMTDQELCAIHPHIVIFAGEAWHLIHSRRQQEGWYDNQSMPVMENADQSAAAPSSGRLSEGAPETTAPAPNPDQTQ